MHTVSTAPRERKAYRTIHHFRKEDAMSRRPNILFIISDQHNAKVLGHAGHPDVQTPHLDRLAAEGVRFENAVTQNPICTPSRVSFLSGQYCHNHGYYGLSGPNPQGLPSVLGHFRKHGYRTGAFGKIHCPEYWVEDDCDEFAEVYENCSVGGTSPYSDYLREKGLFHLRDDAASYGKPNEIKKPHQQFDGRKSDLEYDDSVEAWIVRRSIEFMDGCVSDERPFILQTSLPRPHARYTPSDPYWSEYDEEKISLPPNADYEMRDKAPNLRRMAEMYKTGEWTLFEPRTHEAGRLRKLHGYLGCVSQVDRAVGDLLDWHDRRNLADNTIVLYTTDHGDYACEHGIMEKAPGISSDAITRIPFIWRFPGHAEGGKTVRETVEAVDTATTLCSLAGIEPMETSDGRDLSVVLADGSGDPDRIGVTELAWSRSARWGRYRYVYYPREMFAAEYPEGFGELYDTEQDPWEMHNLYFEEEHQATVKRIKDRLFDWLVTTTRPTTTLGIRPGLCNKGGPDYSAQRVTRFKNVVNADGKMHPDRLREQNPQCGFFDGPYKAAPKTTPNRHTYSGLRGIVPIESVNIEFLGIYVSEFPSSRQGQDFPCRKTRYDGEHDSDEYTFELSTFIDPFNGNDGRKTTKQSRQTMKVENATRVNFLHRSFEAALNYRKSDGGQCTGQDADNKGIDWWDFVTS